MIKTILYAFNVLRCRSIRPRRLRKASFKRCSRYGEWPLHFLYVADRAIAVVSGASQRATVDQTVQLRLEVLRALIDQEIMMQRAEKEGLLASDSDVDAKFNEYKAPYTKEELEKEFEKRKMTEADFKAELRRKLSEEKLFCQRDRLAHFHFR